MKLRNPPIVEAWIEFHARGSEMEETWPHGLDPFFGEIANDFPTLERQVRENYQVVERAPGGIPVQIAVQGELRRVRAFDKPRQHCVQVGRDTLVVNLIRGPEPYEGFHRLLPFALEQLERFQRIFRPISVLTAALHYTDVVAIPRSSGKPARLEDYFRIGVQVPDERNWLLGRVAIDIAVPLATDAETSDQLVLGFRREPTQPGNSEDRFRMDWHAVCSNLDTLEAGVLGARLLAAHEALKQRFRECFTERIWAMFGEVKED